MVSEMTTATTMAADSTPEWKKNEMSGGMRAPMPYASPAASPVRTVDAEVCTVLIPYSLSS